MAHTSTIQVEVPQSVLRKLGGHVSELPEEEQRRLESAPYRHSPQAQWVLENCLLSRKNLAESLYSVEGVEIDERGRITVTESSSLLG